MSVDPGVRRRAPAQAPPAPHPVPWPNLEYPQRSFAFWTVLWLSVTATSSLAAANLGGAARTDRGWVLVVVLATPTAAIGVGVAALVRRTLRRARVRAAAARAGGLSADIDWTSDRTHAVTLFPMRTVIPQVWVIVSAAVAWMILVGLVANHRAPAWLAPASAVVAYALFLAWAVFRGGARVRFERFPYAVGERATFFVAMTAGSPRLEHARYLLRCIRPGGLDLLSGRGLRPVDTLWDQPYDAPPEQWPGPEEFVEVSFDIPANLHLPCTALHGDPVVRWELLVLGRTRWGRLLETFLVPVYAAPSVRGPAASA